MSRMDETRNEYIRGTGEVEQSGDQGRQARLRWFGHAQRRESGYTEQKVLKMELPGKRRDEDLREESWM